MEYEHVFSVVGAKAQPLAQTDLASSGFLECQRLQEWLLANPQILGATRASATTLGGVSSVTHELVISAYKYVVEPQTSRVGFDVSANRAVPARVVLRKAN